MPDSPNGPAMHRVTLQRQLATNFEASEHGIVAVGACVRDSADQAVAGIAVAVPSVRCPRSNVLQLAKVVRAAAAAASADL